MSRVKQNFQPVGCNSGTDYEIWVMTLLEKSGLKAHRTGKDDNGVDMIAMIEIDGTHHKYYIQCKFYNRPVGKAPVQEVYAGCNYYGNDGIPVVITNNRMTSEAVKYANRLGVEIISQYEFNELYHMVQQNLNVSIMGEKCGLLGVIIGHHFNDNEYIIRAVNGKKQAVENERKTDYEQEINQIFDEAEQLMKESAEMQMLSNLKMKKAMELQRTALIKHINYPDTSIDFKGGVIMDEDFDKLIDAISNLTPEQMKRLSDAVIKKRLAEKEKLQTAEEILDFRPCANCGSINTKMNGKVRGKQRYLCKDCHKTFGNKTGSVLVRSKLSEQQWRTMLRGFLEYQSMAHISKNVGISAPNVWINRVKVCTVLLSIYGNQDCFQDIAECDEYYAPVSFKAKRDPAFFMEILKECQDITGHIIKKSNGWISMDIMMNCRRIRMNCRE